MARDTQIVSSADHDAPKDYTIPGNAELILRAVQATFTDNGASGDWLPCVTLITDSGHTIARAIDRGVTITAGSDASVSWFPGVKAAAAGGTGSAYVSATLTALDPAESIAAGSSNFIGYPHVTISDATVFSFTTSGPYTNSLLHVAKAGVVAMRSIVYWSGGNFPRYAVFDTFNPLSAGGSPDSELSTVNPFGLGPLATKDVSVGHAQAGDLIAVRAFNGAAVAQSVTQANLEVIWIG